jgi:hypothetical protein
LQCGHQALAGFASVSIAITLQHSVHSPQILVADGALFADGMAVIGAPDPHPV